MQFHTLYHSLKSHLKFNPDYVAPQAERSIRRQLVWKFTKNFHEQWTKKGFQEGLGGMGMKGKP